jgi:hypothetical protein
MRFCLIFSALIIAVAGMACNTQTTPPNNSRGAMATPVRATTPNGTAGPVAPAPVTIADGVRRVTVTELHDLMQKGEAVVIDVRNEYSYKASHIKGAKLIPHTEIAQRVNELPKKKLVVTYCS